MLHKGGNTRYQNAGFNSNLQSRQNSFLPNQASDEFIEIQENMETVETQENQGPEKEFSTMPRWVEAQDHVEKQLMESPSLKDVEENKRTARNSEKDHDEQKQVNELLAISLTPMQQHEDGQVLLSNREENNNAYDESMQTTNDTRMAQAQHSIDVLRPNKNELTPVQEQ